jgi:hypothetical protein
MYKNNTSATVEGLILIHVALSQQVSVCLVTSHHKATRNSSKKKIKILQVK